MKNNIETLLCKEMHNYFKDNMSKIKIDLGENSFKNKNHFLKCISEDVQDAAWCLCELLNWGMDEKDLDKKWIYTEVCTNDDWYETIYKINDEDGEERYFKIDFVQNKDTLAYTYVIKEVALKTKIVKIKKWEEI